MKCDDAPQFESLDTFVEKINTDNMLVDISDLDQQNDWLSSQGIYFDELRKTLSLTDENGVQWISLTKYNDTENTDVDIDKLLILSWAHAYFVTPEQEILLNECFNFGNFDFAHFFGVLMRAREELGHFRAFLTLRTFIDFFFFFLI